MDLPFDPTLTLGPLRIAWHSLWSLVGMGAGSWVSFRLARRLVKDERIYPFAICVVIGGLIGARTGHIADNWPYYSCLLYTSPSPRDTERSRMPSSA